MSQNINVNLNVPPNVLKMLSDIKTKLSGITTASNQTTSTWSTMMGYVSTFNALANATNHLRNVNNQLKVTEKARTSATNLLSKSVHLNRKATELCERAAKKNLAAQTALTFGAKKSAVAFKLKAAVLGVASVATKALAVGLKILGGAIKIALGPLGLLIAGVAALVAIGRRVVNSLRRNSRAAQEQEQALDELADTWGRTSDEIQFEMRENGLTMEEWEARQTDALNNVADQWGVSADEIKDALGDMTLDEWVAQQERALNNVADRWNMLPDEVMDALGEITLDEWVSQQEAALGDLASTWGVSTDVILGEMHKYNLSMEEWGENRQMLQDIGEQWGMTGDEVVESLARQGVSMQEIITMYPDLARATIDSALAVDSLMQAYDAAFNSALSSIESQIGLFDRLNFTSSKTAQDMVDTWQGQADDMAQHSKNLERAIALGLEPELVDSFSNINRAGDLAAMIASIEEGVEALDDGSFKMSDTASALVDNLNNSFAGVDLGRQDLAHAIAEIQTDFTNGMKEIVQTFETQVAALDMSGASLEGGKATVDGLIQGMQNRQGAAAEAANRLGLQVLREMRRALQISSPSRAMRRLGGFTVQGFAIGMERMQSRVKRVVDRTTNMIQYGVGNILDESRINNQLALVAAPPDSIHQSNLMERLIDAVEAGKSIIMDSGELVGATYGQIDSVSGAAISYSNRWGR